MLAKPRPLRAASAASRLQRARDRRCISLPRCAAARAGGESSSSSSSSAAAPDPTTTQQRRRRKFKTSPPASSSASASPKGADATAILWLEFEEAALGCVKEVSLVVRRPCRGCFGAGTEGGAAPLPCERCRARGSVQTSRTAESRRFGGGRGDGGGGGGCGDGGADERRRRGSGGGAGGGEEGGGTPRPRPSSSSSSSPSRCPLCQGSGVSPLTLRCSDCDGSGAVEETEAARVRVPAGATDATALRIRGAGHSASNFEAAVRLEGGAVMLRPEGGGEGHESGAKGGREGGNSPTSACSRGDAYILCCVAAAAARREWARRGLDVVAPLSLSPFDAVLGVSALPVRTLRGLRILKVPSGTQHGDELVLKGEGAGGVGGEEDVEEGSARRRRASSSSSSTTSRGSSFRPSSAVASAAIAAPGDHVLVVRLRVPEEVNSSDRGLLLRLREIAQRV